MRIAVIGDLMLDVLVELDGPLHADDDTPGRIRMQSGGQAANVAAWVAALGGRALLVCARTDDDSAVRAASDLGARGVEVVGPCVPGRGGVVVSIISGSGERTLVSDPGSARLLGPEHLEGEWFEGCAWLHVSGYHLFDEHAGPAAVRAAELAREHGARISLDLACAARLRELGGETARRRVRGLGADLVFQTAEESDALGGAPLAPVCVEKRGSGGCVVVSGGERLALPASSGRVVDTTGAGDAFAAGFLVASERCLPGAERLLPVAEHFLPAAEGLQRAADDLRDAALGGLAAAARCVAVVGAMPRVDESSFAEAGSP